MKASLPWLVFVFLILTSVGCENPETAKLQARLEQERDPGERARIAVKIGENLFEEISRAYQADDYESGEARLSEYLELLRQAHRELEESGRDARRKPKGFKDLEIHLRKTRRKLQALARRLPYGQRGPVEEVIAAMGEMRTALLSKLMNVDLRNRAEKEKEDERQ